MVVQIIKPYKLLSVTETAVISCLFVLVLYFVSVSYKGCYTTVLISYCSIVEY